MLACGPPAVSASVEVDDSVTGARVPGNAARDCGTQEMVLHGLV